MEDSVPSYLTKNFLKKALENGLKTSDIEVVDFTVAPASGKGENYTSDILRVGVNYKLPQKESQHISLIIKSVHLDGETRQALRELDVVRIETNMYTKVIPQVEQLFGNKFMIAPKYFISDMEANALVFADLKALGYEMQDRLNGLDEVNCKMVMKKIAMLHAGSMYITKQNPKYAEIFVQGIYSEITLESKTFTQMFEGNFQQMISVVRAWPGYEGIATKLDKIISDNFMKKAIDHCKRKEGELRVINHGDLWLNNMMFKYNNSSKAPLDVVFVDLQLSYYASLGIDLNYFFNTSVQIEILKTKRTELLKTYYENLKSFLEQLKYSPIPSWDEVSREVRAKEFYGLLTLGCIFPVIIMDKSVSQNTTIENFTEPSEEKHNAMFSSKRMVESLKYSLKRFDELGVLDE